jgi:putative spermidine/putrescine transport system ATP-binding protein
MTDSAIGLELRHLVKHYGSVEAVRGVNLAVREGEFLTVLGPSGSGKTTILRLVSGFTLPTSGQILLRGRDVSRMTPAERGVGMVFQQYALFPHMTVDENIAYGLKMRGWTRDRRGRRVEEMANLVGLKGMGKRLPRELSGGQQQRVALARALAFEPALLLMDEPLGALDRELRIRMAAELRRIHRELGTTVVYVTHDREEAMTLSDRVAIMHVGLLEALDTPHRLFSRPSTRFVAGFFGGHNLVPATLRSTSNNGHCVVECLGQEFDVLTGDNIRDGSEVWLAIPAPAIRLRQTANREFIVDARVRETLYIGDAVQVTCTIPGGGTVNANVPVAEGLGLSVESDVKLRIDLDASVAVADSQQAEDATG